MSKLKTRPLSLPSMLISCHCSPFSAVRRPGRKIPMPARTRKTTTESTATQTFQNPPTLTATDGALVNTLNVRYTDPKQISIAGCPVTLRTYNGQLTGPTLRIKPGDTMNILLDTLDNQLPVETPDQIKDQYQHEAQNAYLATRPGSFNTTNVHTHGLHVSPVGNSDNVLLAIAPGRKFPYEIKVSRNHAPGSFWYHAHTHGSTSIQVGSGMAGALICVRGGQSRVIRHFGHF